MKAPDLPFSTAARALELARPWALLACYAAVCALRLWWLAPLVALACCLAAFVQIHDTMHAALGLSPRANDALLAASGLLMLKSGHGLRATHLRHHGRCLGEDDPEGVVVHWPLRRVLLEGPFHILAARRLALRIAPRTRRAQLVETALTAVLLAIAVALYVRWGSPAGLIYWAVAAALSATLPLWAAYLPHRLAARNPAVRAAAGVSRLWTPVLSSFGFHHLHHRYPRVPTALLPALARALGPEAALEDAATHHHR